MTTEVFKKIETATDRAIKHVKLTGFDDIFKPPMFLSSIEHQVLKNNVPELDRFLRKEVIKFLSSRNLANCGIGKPRYVHFPKDHQSFRRVAWFEPVDLIKYTALSLMVVDEIEACRIPAAAGIVHSHRLDETREELFTKAYRYDTFRAASAKKTKEYIGGYKLVTDISNFFDRINLHSLENLLTEVGCNPPFVAFLNEVLTHFADGRNSFGIPVGSDASRVLSEAALLNVDRRLQKNKVDFIRYVDDFRVFVRNRSELYKVILLLTEILQDEGLFLNHSKTNILHIEVGTEEDGEEESPVNLEEHEPIDEHAVVEKRKVTFTASGHHRISRYYKKPGQEAIRVLQRLDKKEWTKQLAVFNNTQEKIIRDGVKYFLYIEADLDLLALLIKKKISSIYYIADALVKDGDRLTPDVRDKVVDLLLSELDHKNLCYPHAIPLMRILSSKNFLRTEVLNATIENFGLHENPVYVREVLLLVADSLERAYIRNLAKEQFNRWPIEIQRSIMYIVRRTTKLARAEKDALIKDMLTSHDDLILHNI